MIGWHALPWKSSTSSRPQIGTQPPKATFHSLPAGHVDASVSVLVFGGGPASDGAFAGGDEEEGGGGAGGEGGAQLATPFGQSTTHDFVLSLHERPGAQMHPDTTSLQTLSDGHAL